MTQLRDSSSPAMPSGPGGSDRGVALVIALLAMLLMTALGMALVLVSETESMIGANYRDILVVVGMGFFVIVKNLRKTFARDVQQVRHVVVTRSKNNLTARVLMMAAVTVGRKYFESSVGARNLVYFLVLMDIQFVMIGNAAIVFQSFGAIRLLIEACHGNVTDFEKLGSGKEDQVGGVVIKRVDDAALLDQYCFQAALLKLNPAGKARGPRAHH